MAPFATKVVPAHACREERTLCSASSKKAMPLRPIVDKYRVPRVTWRRCAPNNKAPVRVLPLPRFGGRSCRLGILPYRVARGAGGVRGMERAKLHEQNPWEHL